LCEDLSIRNNRIEENGLQYLGPVHGIFVIYGTQIDISHNDVVGNGLRGENDLQRGSSGGVTVFLSTSTSSLLHVDTEENTRGDIMKHAVRFHDNNVFQPLGRALTLHGLGPMSVVNNQLITEFASVDALSPDVLSSLTSQEVEGFMAYLQMVTRAGSIFILNLGMAPLLQILQSYGKGETVSSNGGDSVSDSGSVDIREMEKVYIEEMVAPTEVLLKLPTGTTMFSNNQVRMGASQNSMISSAIITLDDLSFNNNQLHVFSGPNIYLNSFILGYTIRALGNRLQEPMSLLWLRTLGYSGRLSLLSYALALNNTSNNQGDHCIVPDCYSGVVMASENYPLSELCKFLLDKMQVEMQAIDFDLHFGGAS
jgi:hypothetical protein